MASRGKKRYKRAPPSVAREILKKENARHKPAKSKKK